MASVNSVTSSTYTSSLYNSANIVSGLASGMDTEGMIESLVQSYSTKITQLNQKATKIQWKQEAYQSIIAKMYAFNNKYTSYTSSTNLASPTFFNNARLVEPQGKNADKVAASGRTDSDVVLNSVSQMATAARYVTGGNLSGAGDGTSITATGAVDLNKDMTLGTLQGSLSLLYGDKTISLSFNENDDQYKSTEELAQAIRDKLSNETITFSGGSSAKASDRIDVKVENGKITFSDKSSAGNSVYISGASGTVATGLNLKGVTSSDKTNEITIGNGNFTKQVNTGEYLSGKTMNINLDGTTKTIYGPQITKNDDGTFTFTSPSTVKDANGQSKVVYEAKNAKTVSAEDAANTYTEMLSEAVSNAFGSKVRVSNEGTYDGDGQLRLKFEVDDGSNLLINTDAGDVLNIGKSATSYLNTSKTLGDLMGENGLAGLTPNADGKYDFVINGITIGSYDADTKLSEIMSDINADKDANVKVTYSQTTRSFVFESRETGSESKVDIEKGGLAEAIFGSTELNEHSTGTFADTYSITWLQDGESEKVTFEFSNYNHKLSFNVGKDTTIEDVAAKLNQTIRNDGLTASYNKYTGQLDITDKNGAKVDFTMKDSYGDDLIFEEEYNPGINYTPGQDAKFKVTVNGVEKEMTRGTNNVDIDGLTLSFKGTFEEEEGDTGVSFKVSMDSDTIVNAIKDMVTEYNEMMAEIKSAYATMPYQNSSGAFQTYEPLTDEDRATMSESSIAAYEAKAKQGILFGDSNLKSLYERMYNVFNPAGNDSNVLRNIGLTYSYSSDGTSTLTLDEKKLRSALETDPDSVTDIFTRTASTGGTSGIMEGLKTNLDRYGATTGAVKGILVQQSGTPLSSLSLLDNQWQKEIDNIGTQIESWQDKLSDRVDYYTSLFSRLEVLINQMNSQSSTLAGLMGG